MFQLVIAISDYISKNKPANITAPAIFPVPAILNGESTINIGRTLNTQPQRGRGVIPDTTAIRNDIEKASNPK